MKQTIANTAVPIPAGHNPTLGAAAAVEATGVVKTFGSVPALDGLDLSVHTGEVHGFLGPNGSGKSTTIRILLGLMRADSGVIRLLGGDPWKDAVSLHRRIAYVPGDVSLWANLSGGEVIDLLGRLRGGLDMRRRNELLDLFELDPRKKCRTYSKGNRQKVAIVAAFCSDVELLIMDEPTTGLDPLMEAVFQDCIHRERDLGRTVLLSSHLLSEVEALCDRVSIIRAGAVVETGTLGEMRHLTRTSIVAETRQPVAALTSAVGVHNLVADGGTKVRFDVDTGELETVIGLLARCGVLSLTSSPPTLEELFMRHYGDRTPAADVNPGTAEPGDDETGRRRGGWRVPARSARGAR